jgi:hypothetical protein
VTAFRRLFIAPAPGRQLGGRRRRSTCGVGRPRPESQYLTFVHWFDKRHPFTLTDDLGRSGQVVLTEFVPARKQSRHYPWRQSYTLRGYYLP